jgi:hypothetical protein
MNSPYEQEEAFDLESSCQIELGRIPGRDCPAASSLDDSIVFEPERSGNRSGNRELLRNQFPADV